MFYETKNIHGDKYTAVNIDEIYLMEGRSDLSKFYLDITTSVITHTEEYPSLAALKTRVFQILDLINFRDRKSFFFDFNKDVNEYPLFLDVYRIKSIQMFLSTLENALVLLTEPRNIVLKYEDQNTCKDFYYNIFIKK